MNQSTTHRQIINLLRRGEVDHGLDLIINAHTQLIHSIVRRHIDETDPFAYVDAEQTVIAFLKQTIADRLLRKKQLWRTHSQLANFIYQLCSDFSSKKYPRTSVAAEDVHRKLLELISRGELELGLELIFETHKHQIYFQLRTRLSNKEDWHVFLSFNEVFSSLRKTIRHKIFKNEPLWPHPICLTVCIINLCRDVCSRANHPNSGTRRLPIQLPEKLE